MIDKKKIDNEIEQELEESFDENQKIIEDEDYTVKVHREDYTVKRRFYDKDKALETADNLRQDKRNLVEDDIEHDFVTLINEEDDVDWNKLVDAGLEFDPPISDAAAKKLETTSPIAEELRDESYMVGNKLDKTLAVGRRSEKDFPEINPEQDAGKESPTPKDETDVNDLEIDFEAKTRDLPPEKKDSGTLSGKDKECGTSPQKSGSSIRKIFSLSCIVIIAGALFYYFNVPTKKIEKPVTKPEKNILPDKKTVNPPVLPLAKTPEPKLPLKKQSPVPSAKKAEIKTRPEQIVRQKPVKPKFNPPAVIRYYPYTIHISSYKSKSKADAEVARIKKKGFDAFSSLIKIPGKGNWYRIYSGYYENYDKATKTAADLKTKLREDVVVSKTFFGVQIGSVAQKKELSGLKNRLQAKGYSVYYIPVTPDKNYVKLMAGAFKKETEAAGLFNNLLEDGFNAKIAKR